MIFTHRELRSAARFAVAAIAVATLLAACGGGGPYSHRAAFTSKEFGVAASPRVTRSAHPPHGGGRYLVGDPYKVHGKWYTPKADPPAVQVGKASWYGDAFHGRLTANGEIFSANAITGGSPILPLPCYVRVTNLDNGRALTVRINDRGPYLDGRIIDLSERSAQLLGFLYQGTARVKVEYLGMAPLEGDDTRMLVASLDTSHQFAPVIQVASAKRRHGNPGGLIGKVMSLFTYAEEQRAGVELNSAYEAIEAMSSRTPQLDRWVEMNDIDARKINLSLGVFDDPAKSDEIAERFAYLGAVEPQSVIADGRPATRLVLRRLKPGVLRTDALDLARQLGLRDLRLLDSSAQ